jgi:hypothetical protein
MCKFRPGDFELVFFRTSLALWPSHELRLSCGSWLGSLRVRLACASADPPGLDMRCPPGVRHQVGVVVFQGPHSKHSFIVGNQSHSSLL